MPPQKNFDEFFNHNKVALTMFAAGHRLTEIGKKVGCTGSNVGAITRRACERILRKHNSVGHRLFMCKAWYWNDSKLRRHIIKAYYNGYFGGHHVLFI